MATDVPEGEEPEAPKPPHDADPLGSDPGTVPLVPPGDPSALPGQLETAPDGSIPSPYRLATAAMSSLRRRRGLLQEPLIQPPPAAATTPEPWSTSAAARGFRPFARRAAPAARHPRDGDRRHPRRGLAAVDAC